MDTKLVKRILTAKSVEVTLIRNDNINIKAIFITKNNLMFSH